MTNSRVQKRQIFLAFASIAAVVIASAHDSVALTVAVPSPETMVQASDVIIVGRFKDTLESSFVIEEAIKLPPGVSGTVAVKSPYPEVSFPYDQLRASIAESKTILVGRWDPDRNAVITTYAACSFWPQGTPAHLLPAGDIAALRTFILNQLTEPKALDSVASTAAPTSRDDTSGTPQIKAVGPSPKSDVPESAPSNPTFAAAQSQSPVGSPTTNTATKNGPLGFRAVLLLTVATAIIGFSVFWLIRKFT